MGKLELRNRTVLVTGASRGLGKQIALYLARVEGAHLVLVGRSAAALRRVVEEIGGRSHASIIVHNLLSQDGARVLFEKVQGQEIFGLVNNAGMSYYGETEASRIGLFRSIIDLDFRVVVELSLLFLSRFKDRGEGFILNITSLASFAPIPYQAIYAAAKSAAQSFSESLGVENRRSGVLVSTFAPAGIVTGMIEDAGLTRHMHKHRYFYLTPQRAARLAVKALKRRKRIIVPGLFGRLIYSLMNVLPRPLLLAMSARVFKYDRYRSLPRAEGRLRLDAAPEHSGTRSVLVTGANGFIGSHLCDAFSRSGYEVYGLVRSTSNLKFLKDSQVKLVYGDLREIDSIRLPASVNVIVHAAASVSDNASMKQCRTNIYDITVNLTGWAMRNCTRLGKFVYISTALTLGYCSDDISEENPGKSAEYVPYIYMKKKAEAFLLEQYRRSGFPVVIMRPGDVYGPRDRTSCELMLQAAEANILLMVGRGDKKFGFCFPDNLCKAVLAAVEKSGTDGQAYTVTNSVLPTWRSFIQALRSGVGRPQRIYVPVAIAKAVALLLEVLKRLLPRFAPSINYYRIRRITCQTTYDLSKTVRDLDYEPDNDYRRQFQSILEWYRQDRGEKPVVRRRERSL